MKIIISIIIIIISFKEIFPQNNLELFNYKSSGSIFDILLVYDKFLLDGVQPIQRVELANHLIDIKHSQGIDNTLSEIISFNLEKLYPELNSMENTSISPPWYLYMYNSKAFNLYFQPILGLEYQKSTNGYSLYRFNGINFFGNFNRVFSYQFSFQDNFLKGSNFDAQRILSPLKAFDERQTEFDQFDGGNYEGYISYNFSSGNFSVGKYSPIVGYSRYHSVILSDKAPSFPQISLNINFTDCLKFHYFHGWLKSGIEDSTLSYQTLFSKYDRKQYRPKYIANHSIELKPSKNLALLIGESIIYSDTDVQLLYLLPISFFHAADRYYSSKADATSSSYGGNSQIFCSFKYQPFSGVLMNGSLFIDEISITNIFDKQKSRNKVAFQVGLDIINPFFKNNFYTMEFSRILPWTYTNFIQTQTYENDSYSLGHWLGQNGDELLIGSYLYLLKNLKLSVLLSFIRKGGLDSIYIGYEDWQRAFLYDKIFSLSDLSCSLEYELLHNLYIFTSLSLNRQQIFKTFERKFESRIIFSIRYRYY